MKKPPNPHPDVECEACGQSKPCVAWKVCSQECARIMGYSTKGLPDRIDKLREKRRELGLTILESTSTPS
jgi:hypothetical protein